MINATQLRQDIYNILDRVLDTGQPIEVERRGKRLRIVPVVDPLNDRLAIAASVGYTDLIVGDPEDLVHLDWSENWHSDLP